MWTAVSPHVWQVLFFCQLWHQTFFLFADWATNWDINRVDWLVYFFIPTGIILWSVTPLLGYYLYPRQKRKTIRSPSGLKNNFLKWATNDKRSHTYSSGRWCVNSRIGCSGFIDPAIASLVIISLWFWQISFPGMISSTIKTHGIFLLVCHAGCPSFWFIGSGVFRWAGDQIAGSLSGFGEVFTYWLWLYCIFSSTIFLPAVRQCHGTAAVNDCSSVPNGWC